MYWRFIVKVKCIKSPTNISKRSSNKSFEGFKNLLKSLTSLSNTKIWQLEDIVAGMDAPKVKKILISRCKQLKTNMIGNG